jgi:hypothetical protein
MRAAQMGILSRVLVLGHVAPGSARTYAAPNAMARVPVLEPASGFWQTAELLPAEHVLDEALSDVDELRSASVRVTRCMASLPFSASSSKAPCRTLERCKSICLGSLMVLPSRVRDRVWPAV